MITEHFFTEIAQLKQELSLAVEGLENYEEEMEISKQRGLRLAHLEQEIADLRRSYEYHKGNAEQLRESLKAIRDESLTCAMICQCTCDGCQRLYSVIRRSALPQPCHGQTRSPQATRAVRSGIQS
jgi:DNA repair exonuclease SbcCD ATPase subunit